MKKIIIVFLALMLFLCFAGCNKRTAVLDEVKTYEVISEIHSLDIKINAADFKVERNDKFSVKSNLKYLSVSEQNGVLIIEDEAKSNSNYSNPVLTLYVPNGVVFDDVYIETGAAKMTIGALSARTAQLKLGAGDVHFNSLNAISNAKIEGGAGQITIDNGTINDLSLQVGMGELNLTATLLGNSELDFGVGKSNITLIGKKEDYKIDVKKGLGSIKIDGKTYTDFENSGIAQNHVNIEGGVGAIDLKFQEE